MFGWIGHRSFRLIASGVCTLALTGGGTTASSAYLAHAKPAFRACPDQLPASDVFPTEVPVQVPAGPLPSPAAGDIEARLDAITRSIATTSRMTSRQFEAWWYHKNVDGSDNQITTGLDRLGQLYNAPCDFPYPNSLSIDQPTMLLTEEDPQHLVYENLPGISGRRRLPRVPHLSLFNFYYPTNPQTFETLSFFDGYVTVPLPDRSDANVTISFGTQVWPDGTKTTYGWVTNVHLPGDPRLSEGPDLSGFPIAAYTPTKNRVYTFGSRGREVNWSEFLGVLDLQVGRPIVHGLASNAALADAPRVIPDGSGELYRNARFVDGVPVPRDLRMPGIDPVKTFAVFDAIRLGYFSPRKKDFRAAVTAAQEAGVFAPRGSDPDKIRTWLDASIAKLTSLEAIFETLPLGSIVFLPGATRPPQLPPGIAGA